VTDNDDSLEQPVFIVAPPRAGGTLLIQTVARSSHVWTIGGESHKVIEGIPNLHPRDRGWDSNRLTANDATPAVVAELTRRLVGRLRDRDGRQPAPNDHARLVEKTPKNALRVAFLAAAFPDARFVYLHREPVETISSMLDGWWSQEFVTYNRLPGWARLHWSFLLVPGWRDLAALPIPAIVVTQWSRTVETLIDDLAALAPAAWWVTSFDQLVTDPGHEVGRLAMFLGFSWDTDLAAPLAPSRSALTPPSPGKWQANVAELEPYLSLASGVIERCRAIGHGPALGSVSPAAR